MRFVAEGRSAEEGAECQSTSGDEAVAALRLGGSGVGPGSQDERPAVLLLLWRPRRVSDTHMAQDLTVLSVMLLIPFVKAEQ